MKRKAYELSMTIWTIIWFAFTIIAYISKQDLGTVATLGGITIMFASMLEQSKVKN